MSVSAFSLYKLHDIPESLRQLANKIEHDGNPSSVRCLVILECDDGTIDYKAFGEEPYTKAHAMGLCHAAIQEIYDPKGE